jgi:hypothetical protein
VLAVLTSVKLQFAVMLPWLIGTRDGRAIRDLILVGAALAAISVLGAGIDAHIMYPSVVTSFAPHPWSLAALTGVSWLNTAVLVAGCVGAIALHRHPTHSFRMAVVTMVFGVSAFGPVTATLLLGLAIPVTVRGGRTVDVAPAIEAGQA